MPTRLRLSRQHQPRRICFFASACRRILPLRAWRDRGLSADGNGLLPGSKCSPAAAVHRTAPYPAARGITGISRLCAAAQPGPAGSRRTLCETPIWAARRPRSWDIAACQDTALYARCRAPGRTSGDTKLGCTYPNASDMTRGQFYDVSRYKAVGFAILACRLPNVNIRGTAGTVVWTPCGAWRAPRRFCAITRKTCTVSVALVPAAHHEAQQHRARKRRGRLDLAHDIWKGGRHEHIRRTVC